jgi:DNA-binding SARP family transcriptional activator
MPRLAFHLLGPPRLERDGEPLAFDTRKITALVAYLAVTGQPHTREALITLLWPELEPGRARAVLRRNLSLLRKALDGEWLVVDRETIRLDPDAEAWVDVDQFEPSIRIPQESIHRREKGLRPLHERRVARAFDDEQARIRLRRPGA